MKKITLIAAVAVLASTFASCKKAYTCTCTSSSGGASYSASEVYPKMSKSDAEAKCSANNVSSNGGSVTCTIS